MTKEIATVQQPGAGAVMAPKTIIELAQGKAVIQHVLKAIMKGPSERNPLGVHYGIIPGTPKPCLLKPGSELILSTFRISVDAETEDLSTDDCIRYRVKAIGRLPDGTIVGYGVGECSTDEEKYRWKKPACDEEWQAADPTKRREKWFKGQGNKPAYQVKQIRTVPADLANTVLKMAKKRAQIDLTLTATGASDVFEQDLEDLKDVIDITDYQRQPSSGKPEVKEPTATGGQGGNGQGEGQGRSYAAGEKIKPGGAVLIRKTLEGNNVTEREFCVFMNIAAVEDLLSGDFNRAMQAIKSGDIPALAE